MLITPTVLYEASYKEYIKELGNEERYPYPLDLDHSNFASFVNLLNGYSKGVNLPENLVPNTTFWLIENSEIVGCSHLRHCLNDALRFAGGHIGLGIRPSKRGQGYGMKLLNLTLEKAFEIGVDEVHIHCYKSNKVSSSLIASSGAKLDSIVETQGKNEQVLRFVHSRC
ncbi:GNAT family N-acetyltransferase [Alteromonas sp. KS69]|jgi:predicted acetyltransferase|uniref:GNAT family acetyltransferase n=1 Tax=Alteromonas naphthalenivorans TaxID=715451 RepID=F5ZCM4_ALTNA|nr:MULTISPECIES: GNAT family N-acetyltransferase [Alteromonas]PHS48053.1 MAG: GNAT family N-acetyltransferase [Alteromonas sp.]AEF02773.1 GNAT family acetyltransferase [Alteromonas naphthalenivorans]MBO7924554.1 GNAT family N-acetyltransferase [Alteromonas sp. K632G]RUP75046.1 GNAT family N-acetyltransferase [Alteromonas sp. KS69]CAD5270977.1 GNAT family N-acetyltransferase [Alteromonas sp. 154]|tara:strand:- start:632 stop:1138 length:507 start_codon:yes stop_codon:yes gene_type:complete